jgi:hypothetical protein
LLAVMTPDRRASRGQRGEESTRTASNWLRQNMPNSKTNPPQVIGGGVTFRFANYPARV